MKSLLLGGLFLVATTVVAATDPQITGIAKNAQFKACLSTVSALEKFFGEGNNYGSWASWATSQPDKQPFNVSMEITFSDGDQLVDFTVTPTPDGECSYVYTRTWFSPKSCIATSKEGFLNDAKYKTDLNKNIAAFEDGGTRVLLMPAGSGCVVQKKEVGFRHKKQGT
ncbi:hypothetical protein [Zhongshania marina]|uniref:Uncharacterized protein n=1 Tax=Zhongshania marina TaxID=2304603 RepID=A0A2S4HF89_9GAMM|nr:hypothetical protein [Marortus luteolus]POP52620.1 hypothetical protein C0068_11115 [Marortus luteolus]